MSSEADPSTSPVRPSDPMSAPTANGAPDSAQATSDANVTSTDPKPTDRDATPESDMNPDEKAADVAEGAVTGSTVVIQNSAATPASTKKGKNEKRRSSGIPEHKSKKKGGKKEVVLNMDAAPGDYYFARLKGHPDWPSIIADEDMLPETMLATRPVTARHPDGTYREDFNPGGKKQADRTYPVMFLYTNEFAWMKNTELTKLKAEDIEEPEKKKLSKKGLLDAYKVAAKFETLDHYKKLLYDFEEARRAEELNWHQEQEEKQTKSAKKEEKAAAKLAKAKRKSSAVIGEDEDEVMEDSSEAPKSSKKRKKDPADSEAEDKPAAKTPKIKLNASKATSGDSAAKSKKAKSTPKSAGKAKESKEPPPMTEQERQEKKHQSVLYLRHKLQKGFLQNTAPKESEMGEMANHFTTLEQYKELEVPIIRNTKIHKVLKALLKLDYVPKDDTYNFKTRSTALLDGWLEAIAQDDKSAAEAAPATNGATVAKAEEPKVEDTPKVEEWPKTEDVEMKDAPAVTEPPTAPVEIGTSGNDAKDEATDGGVSMEDAVKIDKSDVPSADEAAAAEPAATMEATVVVPT